MRVARFRRDVASLKKSDLEKRVAQLGCENLVVRSFTKAGSDRTTKEAYILALKKHCLRQDFGEKIPKQIRDSLVYRPSLGSLWDFADREVWEDCNWRFEPLYTGFRVTISVSAGKVYAFSRYDSDDRYRRPLVSLPEETEKALGDQLQKAVVDAMLVVDMDELNLVFQSLGIAVTEHSSLDVALAQGEDTQRILGSCKSFKVVLLDILEDFGEEVTAKPYRERKELLERRGGGLMPWVGVAPSLQGDARAKARFYAWCRTWTDGCAVKHEESPYQSCGRSWKKLKNLPQLNNDCSVAVWIRGGQAFVEHPALGEVVVAESIDFEGPGRLTFHAGRLTSVVMGRSGGNFCVWDPDQVPLAIPQRLEALPESGQVQGAGVSLRTLLGG